MLLKYAELDYHGELIKARNRPGGITTEGTARESYATWEVDVRGAQCAAFRGDWETDNDEKLLKARLREWADAHPELFA